MSILSGYEKYKRHLKIDDENYKLVSEWTHADTVEMSDGSSLTQKIDDMSAQTDALVGNEYDSTTTYNVGDYCIYNGKWYKCIVEITEAEEWNSEHWIITNISHELKSIQTVRYIQEDNMLQVYHNNTWRDVMSIGLTKKYLYKYGNMFISDTGGYNYSSTKYIENSSIKNSESGMIMSSSSTGLYDEISNPIPNFTIINPIYICNFSKLVIDWNATGSNGYFSSMTALLISDNKDFSGSTVLTIHEESSYDGIEEFDISSYFGNYYIGFAVFGEIDSSATTILRQLYLTV